MLRSLALTSLVALFAVSCKSTEAEMVSGNAMCPISGHEVDGKSSVEVGGMTVNTCCADCIPAVEKDPSTAIAKAYPGK